MNCANHPEVTTSAFCQYCGKPLCSQCVRNVNGVISCEPCLAARLQGTGGTVPGAGSMPVGLPAAQPWGSEPWIAFLLGWIPGVGAMYNGQLAKGLAHVVIFAILVDLSRFNGALGILIAAWVFYQVFDAYQTAAARRDGLPLPNPLGLNDIGRWFGARSHGGHPGAAPWHTHSGDPNATSGSSTAGTSGTSGASAGIGEVPPASGFAASSPPPPVTPGTPTPYYEHNFWCSTGRGIPTGAIVLIVLGVAFLLGNLGILSARWIDNGWPILLIGLGVWLAVRRRNTPPAGGIR